MITPESSIFPGGLKLIEHAEVNWAGSMNKVGMLTIVYHVRELWGSTTIKGLYHFRHPTCPEPSAPIQLVFRGEV